MSKSEKTQFSGPAVLRRLVEVLPETSCTSQTREPVSISGLTGAIEDSSSALPLNESVEGQLRARNQELEEMLKEKDLLLGVVSHELRTPLTTIFGNASILLRRLEEMDADTRTRAISDIREEAERLNGLVENMLLLARAGVQAPVPTEPVAVGQALSEVISEHVKRFRDRTVVVDVKPKGMIANGQPDYMKQVVQNLLGNAEKYSPGDNQIDVRARRTGDEVTISILDRGPGIALSESDIIFQAFYRSALTSTKVTGAGIGLAVCKLLVQAQSGRIWARPRRGGGSIFSFTLPVVFEETDRGAETA